MAWHSITHSCGHTDRYQLVGPSRTRTWRAERLAEELCPACRQAERDAKNAAAAAANAECGLPALVGTERQIAWAETIRAAKLELIGRALSGELIGLERTLRWGELSPKDPDIPETLDRLQAIASAAWWIDHRDFKAADLLLSVAQERPAAPREPDSPAAAVLAEATLRPAQERTATVAEIRIDGPRLAVLFPEKRDDFRSVVKALGYRWEPSALAWVRIVDQWSGPLADRAAELGNALLAAGFCVRIQDPAIRAAAVAADFPPERKRWVKLRTSGPYLGWLVLAWPREDDLFSAAKALPGSRYDKPHVLVPAAQYEAVADFAEAHAFAIGEKAQEAMDAARTAHEQALLAVPRKARKAPKGQGTMPDIPEGIDDALRDAG